MVFPVLGSRTYSTAFLASLRSRTFPVSLSTTKVSGVTEPLTTDSPRPQFPSMTIFDLSPVAGWMVKMTPADFEFTIFWTATLRATCMWSNPFSWR